jgi:hypothetical protein
MLPAMGGWSHRQDLQKLNNPSLVNGDGFFVLLKNTIALANRT